MSSPVTSQLAKNAKTCLEKFAEEIGPRFEKLLDAELAKKSGYNHKEKALAQHMLTHVKDYLLRPQKRLRPSFVYYGYMLGATPDEQVWQAAMAVDIVHAAILMHDDFMDQDVIRRGGPTSHEYYKGFMGGDKHYGEAMAVTVGDLGWNLGYEILASSGFAPDRLLAALQFFFRTIIDTAYGQAFDVTLPLYKKWTEEDVVVVHTAKTARYTYENPLITGAILAGVTPQARKLLHDYSMAGGVAFQLQDDLLGVFGTPEKTGKSANSDLLQGKATVLIHQVLEKGTSEQKQQVLKVWGKQTAADADIELAKQAITDSGSADYSRVLAQKYAGQAAETANQLRQLKLNPQAIDYLQGIALYMIERAV
ncbi:MAG: polyprenyl synthetase family protein [bacterium]|nr:polyprenyl synthetase family protein [bacterium]